MIMIVCVYARTEIKRQKGDICYSSGRREWQPVWVSTHINDPPPPPRMMAQFLSFPPSPLHRLFYLLWRPREKLEREPTHLCLNISSRIFFFFSLFNFLFWIAELTDTKDVGGRLTKIQRWAHTSFWIFSMPYRKSLFINSNRFMYKHFAVIVVVVVCHLKESTLWRALPVKRKTNICRHVEVKFW